MGVSKILKLLTNVVHALIAVILLPIIKLSLKEFEFNYPPKIPDISPCIQFL